MFINQSFPSVVSDSIALEQFVFLELLLTLTSDCLHGSLYGMCLHSVQEIGSIFCPAVPPGIYTRGPETVGVYYYRGI